MGIHRVSHSSANSLTPLQRHVRSLLWYQICFLDFKTAEAQGPHPSIRCDDFDIAPPLNVDDDVFEFGSPSWQQQPTSVNGWSDATLSLIRYECNEIHRFIFRGRIEMDRKHITLHDLRTRVDARKRQIQSKYLQYLDASVPIQRYAGLVATLLMARCDSMAFVPSSPSNVSAAALRSRKPTARCAPQCCTDDAGNWSHARHASVAKPLGMVFHNLPAIPRRAPAAHRALPHAGPASQRAHGDHHRPHLRPLLWGGRARALFRTCCGPSKRTSRPSTL